MRSKKNRQVVANLLICTSRTGNKTGVIYRYNGDRPASRLSLS